jgi:hypothetical protein
MPLRAITLATMALFLLVVAPAWGITVVKDGQPAASIVIRESAVSAKPFATDATKPNDVPSPDAKVRFTANDLTITGTIAVAVLEISRARLLNELVVKR